MSLYAVGLSMCLAMTNGAANLNLDAHPGDVEGVVHDRYTARVNQGTAEKEKEKETETQQQPMNPSRVQVSDASRARSLPSASLTASGCMCVPAYRC